VTLLTGLARARPRHDRGPSPPRSRGPGDRCHAPGEFVPARRVPGLALFPLSV